MKKLLLLAILPFVISCNGQEKDNIKSLLEEPLQLNNFSFRTHISTLLPDKAKSKDFDGYDIKSEGLEVKTISIDNELEYYGNENPVKYVYQQFTYSYDETLAKFDDYEFNAINFITTNKGKIMAVNVIIDQVTLNKAQKIIQILDKKYGASKKTKGFTSEEFAIYTWSLKDRMIRYSIVQADKLNEKDADLYCGRLYIIDNTKTNDVLGKVSSGDFIYLNEEQN